jgi:hypothetical protein
MYPQTFSGLLLSYEAGLPFVLNSLAGDLFFSAVLFGSYYYAASKNLAWIKVKK